MKKYIETLKKCPLFLGIEEDEILKMLSCLNAKVEFFDKKYTIFTEGSAARYIGIVLTGSVQIIQIDYLGNRSILSTASTADVFAEAFACAGTQSLPVSVVANEPCEIMLIDRNHILHTCSNVCSFHQSLIFNLMNDLALKVLSFHRKIEITSKRTTREKLLTFLNIEMKKTGKSEFDIAFDRQELADYLEVDRSGLSAEISKLRGEGVIECRKNHFKIIESYI